MTRSQSWFYKVLIECMTMWHSENTNVEYSDLCVKQSDARRGVQVCLQRYQDSLTFISLSMNTVRFGRTSHKLAQGEQLLCTAD